MIVAPKNRILNCNFSVADVREITMQQNYRCSSVLPEFDIDIL